METIDVARLAKRFDEGRIVGKLQPNFIVFRSHDYKAIRALAIHPRILPQISDDFTSDPKQWQPIESEQVVYLLGADDAGPFGFGIFIPQTHIQFAAHVAFLPRSYGNLALTAFKEMLAWMWQNTQARRIVGEIVRENKLAIRFARRAGFKIYGINDQSYLRGGILRDQFCLGISKPSSSETKATL